MCQSMFGDDNNHHEFWLSKTPKTLHKVCTKLYSLGCTCDDHVGSVITLHNIAALLFIVLGHIGADPPSR